MTLSRSHLDGLADRFRAVHYTLDPVLQRLGDSGNAGLVRNSTLAAQDALGSDRDPQASLVRLFLLQRPVPRSDAADALGELLEPLLAEELLIDEGGTVRAAIEIRPYGEEAWSGWICHDLNPGLDRLPAPVRPDFVLGASPASTTLAQLTIREPVGSALDLGTGCGVQSLHLARHASRVVATDVNPRALMLARMTADLNGIEVDLREGSLYEPVAGERFDLIVSNPPYVMSPPNRQELTYRETGFPGDELVRLVIAGARRMLNPGGTMQVLANWAVTDEPWQDRLRGWIEPTGCDALVLERERLDPYEYIEMWLTDAGLAGSPDHLPRYREWLSYFDRLGITGIGMGWFSLRATRNPTPSMTFEEWPHQVHQPVGGALATHWRGVDLTAVSDEDLMARAWTLNPGITQETLGRPGAADPEHVVFRQGYGLGRATEVDTALGAVLGACDGELPLGRLVTATASLLGADSQALAEEMTPRIRELIVQGYLGE